MGARFVAGIRSRTGVRRETDLHYITASAARELAAMLRERDEQNGIFRRWNDRRLTPAQKAKAARARRLRPRARKPKP